MGHEVVNGLEKFESLYWICQERARYDNEKDERCPKNAMIQSTGVVADGRRSFFLISNGCTPNRLSLGDVTSMRVPTLSHLSTKL